MMEEVFENLKKNGLVFPWNNQLVDEKSIELIEKYYSIALPKSYKLFLERYSNISLGGFTALKPLNDGSYLDLFAINNELRENEDFPPNYLAFLYDNGDSYCFDLNSDTEDFKVYFWSHDGISNEYWPNFVDWVVNCWIAENES
jgi:hypothetical protein